MSAWKRTNVVQIICGFLVIVVMGVLLSHRISSGISSSYLDRGYAPLDSLHTDIRDYQWPINAPRIVTSSFAEFRSSHFHGGLDIATDNKVGAEVYATRKGSVVRLSVSPYGYGKLLVVKHDDGFFSTYGHLWKFVKPLEQLVREELQRTGKLSTEMEFSVGQIPVEKNELIAYAGESGAGKPHLHFEIRDQQYNPVNPLLFPNISDMTDSDPPIFYQLAVVPTRAGSFVDNEWEPKVYKVYERTASSYAVLDVIHATGSIGFAIEVADRGNHPRYKTSVYALAFHVDGKMLFTSRRDRFPESETHQIGLDYEWDLYREQKGRFQKLYLDYGNTLPFYDGRKAWQGMVGSPPLKEGLHTFRIIALDYAGNRSELTGMFILNHPPSIALRPADHKFINVFFSDTTNVSSLDVSVKNIQNDEWHTTQIPFIPSVAAKGWLPLSFPDNDPVVARVVARTRFGTQSFPAFHFPENVSRPVQISIKQKLRDHLLTISLCADAPFTGQPSLIVQHGDKVDAVVLLCANETTYSGSFELPLTNVRPLCLKAFCEVAGRRTEIYDSIGSTLVTPEDGGRFISSDGNFMAEFPPRAVFAPTHLYIEKRGTNIYSLEPHDVMIRGGIKITFRGRDRERRNGPLLLYSNSGSGWHLVGATRSIKTGEYILNDFGYLGAFGLFYDSKSPILKGWKISTVYDSLRPLFWCTVRDDLSGVDPDAIDLTLNNERILPDYDPEKRLLSYVPEEQLPRGRYTVRLEVKDRAGNAAHLRKTFTLYR